jgi:hypothetical protein
MVAPYAIQTGPQSVGSEPVFPSPDFAKFRPEAIFDILVRKHAEVLKANKPEHLAVTV